MYAALMNTVPILPRLLDQKETLNVQDAEGLSALDHAVKDGATESVRCLLSGGARVDVASGTSGLIPLHRAVMWVPQSRGT